ncbi:hypothetical protein BC629DRAFT_1447408 [Irpex lacteus]|nr:hypothetical protein BC629DRAFT_1447408 [Irpex lacteus]
MLIHPWVKNGLLYREIHHERESNPHVQGSGPQVRLLQERRANQLSYMTQHGNVRGPSICPHQKSVLGGDFGKNVLKKIVERASGGHIYVRRLLYALLGYAGGLTDCAGRFKSLNAHVAPETCQNVPLSETLSLSAPSPPGLAAPFPLLRLSLQARTPYPIISKQQRKHPHGEKTEAGSHGNGLLQHDASGPPPARIPAPR